MKNEKKEKKFKISKFKTYQLLIFLLYVLVVLVDLYIVYKVDIFPLKYIYIYIAISLLIIFLSSRIFFKRKKCKAFKTFFIILLTILTIIYGVGYIYLYKTYNFFDNVLNIGYKTEVYKVFVLKDSNYKTIEDVKEEARRNGISEEQIESILSQDYDNYNLIVLENCSNDGTCEYLNSINNSKLSIIPSENLLSMEENWSRVLKTQRGDYTIFAMADDRYEMNYLSELTKLINKYPGKNIYRTNVTIINEESKEIGKSNIKETINFYEYLQGRLAHTYFETFQGYCFDTDFYNQSGGIECIYKAMYMDDKFVLTAIDNDFMPVSSEHACCYRINASSVSGSPDFEADIAGYNYFFNWLKEKNDKKILKIIRQYLPVHIEAFSKFFTQDQMSEYKKIYKLFNINFTSKIYKIKKWFKKYFYIKNENDFLKIRILFIKINKSKYKTLLICRFDGIGDYMLMRRYLKNIRNSKK